MKGAIIVPTFYLKRHQRGIKSQRSKFLFSEITKQFKFLVVYTDAPNLKNLDVAIIYAVPYHNRPKIPPGILKSKTKLIGYFEDLQCWGNKICEKNKKVMFDRYDILMGACYKSFKKFYPEHMHKYVHFPNFFFPLRRYKSLYTNRERKMRCLMAGTVNTFYPFRVYIQKKGPKLLDVSKVPFDRYPVVLSEYFCAIAVPGKLRNVVAKYLEIPAAGTLMLAERLTELDMMGLKPGIHYVPITKESVFEQIKKVLNCPEKYDGIRKKGTKFVHENHSEMNRAAQFGKILKML